MQENDTAVQNPQQAAELPTTPEEVLSTKNGRWPVFIKLFVVAGIAASIGELIGRKEIPIGVGSIIILPMIFALLLTVLLTPKALGQKFKALKNLITEKEIQLAESVLMMLLLLLGVKLGIMAGPDIMRVIEAGPALIFQELGNLGTMLIGLPIALLLGMRREAIGATVSVCREPTVGLIGETYGINSPEGIGVMGTYVFGNLFGTIFFSLLASLAALTSLHPYALGMACGIGSTSMMLASSQTLATIFPAMANEITVFAATSNVLTNVTGMYVELFIALPLANLMYKRVYSRFFKENRRAKA